MRRMEGKEVSGEKKGKGTEEMDDEREEGGGRRSKEAGGPFTHPMYLLSLLPLPSSPSLPYPPSSLSTLLPFLFLPLLSLLFFPPHQAMDSTCPL